MAKKYPYLRVGTNVVATKRIDWHGVHIPKGAPGKLLMQFEGGEAARIDFGNYYGKMDIWASEFKPVR